MVGRSPFKRSLVKQRQVEGVKDGNYTPPCARAFSLIALPNVLQRAQGGKGYKRGNKTQKPQKKDRGGKRLPSRRKTQFLRGAVEKILVERSGEESRRKNVAPRAKNFEPAEDVGILPQ